MIGFFYHGKVQQSQSDFQYCFNTLKHTTGAFDVKLIITEVIKTTIITYRTTQEFNPHGNVAIPCLRMYTNITRLDGW